MTQSVPKRRSSSVRPLPPPPLGSCRSASRDLIGTINCGRAVDTTCGRGPPPTRSAGPPSAALNSPVSVTVGPYSGCACTIVTSAGAPFSVRMRTGSTPAPVSCHTSVTPVAGASISPNSASVHHVPMVGCPANGISAVGVKNRTFRVATSESNTNVVSERFISRARACMVLASSPVPSGNTASALPVRGTRVKTSICRNRCRATITRCRRPLPAGRSRFGRARTGGRTVG